MSLVHSMYIKQELLLSSLNKTTRNVSSLAHLWATLKENIMDQAPDYNDSLSSFLKSARFDVKLKAK